MELDENYPVDELEEDAVEIYSRRAIFWFFFLLGPLFGGVLLMINLKEAGYKKAVNSILIYVISFDVITEILSRIFISLYKIDITGYQQKISAYKPNPNDDPFAALSKIYDPKITSLIVLMLALRVGGAFILTRYFFKKYFPDNDYYPKPILNALLISILVWVILQFIGLGDI
jgi:hypothetical protein